MPKNDIAEFEKMGPHVLVQQILNRDVHCGSSLKKAIRECRSRLEPGAWERMNTLKRRYFVWSVLIGHAANLDLYAGVLSGRFDKENGHARAVDALLKPYR